MKRSLWLRATVSLVIAGALAPNLSLAWGHRGHEMLATIGSQIVKTKGAFWLANAAGMGRLTNVPDQYWKSGPNANNEKPTHWFEPDSYSDDPKQFALFPRLYPAAVKQYTEAVVIANGTAPWRIKQMYDLAVKAFRAHDFVTGLQMAGAMSHYIGDLSQPLHVSKNYDGQLTGDPGIHKFFESTNLESANADQLKNDVTDAAKKLLADKDFTDHFSGNLVDQAFAEIDRSYALKDELIETDIDSHRNSAKLLALAIPRLADGAASLAMILEQLSIDGKLSDDAATVAVTIPTWVAPNFGTITPPHTRAPAFYQVSPVAELVQSLDADCDQ